MKKLERRLGLVSVIAISLSAMLGSGLFVLPGLAAAKTGPSVWLAYLIAALCVLPAALSKSELATAMPFSGGTYIYLERSFGPLVGTIAGLGLWASFMLKSAFALVGFSAYLEVLTGGPVLDIRVMAELLLLGIIAVNIVGVRAVSKIQLFVVMTSLAGLAVLSLWGLTTRDAAVPMLAMDKGVWGLLSASGFVFVAYAGVTKVAAIAEEVQDPGRNLPLGILLALLISSTIYAAVTYVIVGNVPVAELGGKTPDLRPVYTFAQRVGGETVGKGAAVLAVMTMVSMGLAGVLASSRFPFAMGRDHLLPDGQAALSARFGTPINAIVVTGLVMGAAIAVLDIEKIAKLASGFKIMIFIAVNFAVILLREAKVQWYKPEFRSPLYPLPQLFGVLAGAGLLVVMGPTALIGAAGLVVFGAAFYFAYGRYHATHLGLLQRMGQRKDLLPPEGLTGSGDTVGAGVELPAAEVAVPLFGWEVSPDALVEVGAALVEEGERIEVLQIREVAMHTSLIEAAEDGRDVTRALERRVERLGGELGIEVHHDAVYTRDMRHSVHDYARRAACKWLVMEWVAADRRGTFVADPLAWLLSHLSCNLALFKDAGGHHGRRIMVVVEPGPHDALVATTAAKLARVHGAGLTFFRALPERAAEWELEAVVDYHEQLGQLCGVPSESVVVRAAQPQSAKIQATADYDLLVTGAPPERGIWGLFVGSAHDRLIEESVCSVLRLKTPRKETHWSLPGASAGPSDGATARSTEGTARGAAGGSSPEEARVDLLELVVPERIAPRLTVTRKKELFRAIAELYATDARYGTAAALEAALWQREKMQNTAIGDAIAIPHATVAGTPGTALAVVTLAAPLDYQAAGAQPVGLVFVTVGPPSDRQSHLALLSSLSRLLLDTDLAGALRAAEDIDQIRAAFAAAQQHLT